MKKDIQNIAVIGSGIMGAGIAQVAAEKGFQVFLHDVNEEALQKALKGIQRNLDKAVEKKILTTNQIQVVLSRIFKTTDLKQAVHEADLVVEAVVEDTDIKKELFSKLDSLTRPETILATNTSQIPITQIGSAVSNPARVVGMHWFNPPTRMKLIEVIQGLETSKETLERTCEVCRKLEKEPIVVKDRQGFLVNRALGVFLAECFRMLDEGVSTAEEIDTAIKLGLGHPMGPFELADMIGIDTILKTSEQMHKIYGERRLPPQILRLMAAAGRYGRKTKKGFYDYDSELKIVKKG